METWIRREEVFKGKIFSLFTGEVQLDNGEYVTRDIIHHDGGVAIVPILGDSVVLISQFRISIGREILELPAGRIEGNDTPASCARRELEEELGFRTGKLILAASYYSSVGFTDEKMHIFFALELEKVATRLEPDERVKPVSVPIAKLSKKLANDEIEDSKTIIGLRALLAHPQYGKSL